MLRYCLIFALGFFAKTGIAQVPFCESLPVDLDTSSIYFGSTTYPGADSGLYFNLINNTTTDYAFSEGRLEILSPLPSGTSLVNNNTGWPTIVSFWNAGTTFLANYNFVVSQPIPPNYSLTFNLYLRPRTTPTYYNDTCVFGNSFSINLNPAPVSIFELHTASYNFKAHPNPAKNNLTVKFNTSGIKNEILIVDLNGKLIQTYKSNESELTIDVERIESGVYYLVSKDNAQKEKLVIIK